jgi:hypothetical protein
MNDPQKWLDYLEGTLPEDERRRLEEEIAQSDFLKEALEGLKPLREKEDLREVSRQLNQQLRKQLKNRKPHRRSRASMNQVWVIVTLLVVLLFIFLGYYFYTHS